MNNTNEIIKSALCTGCGGCAGLCPQKAIVMQENPAGYLCAQLNEALCVDCGECLSVCPSNWENQLCPKDGQIGGVCLVGYVGYATDEDVRKNGQSGGIVTALLIHMIEDRLIDAALVNQFDPQTRRPVVRAASTRAELIASGGSCYAQSAVVERALQCESPRMAVVALGCQAESLDLARQKHPSARLPEYVIGLVCSGQHSGHLIDELIAQTQAPGVNPRVESFRFRDKRDNGWPGDVSLQTERGRFTLPKEKRIALRQHYECCRCRVCFDKMNLYSDIVCGDPWGIADRGDSLGQTVIIARTEKGRNLLESAASKGVIKLDSVAPEDILREKHIETKRGPQLLAAELVFKKYGWPWPHAPRDDLEQISSAKWDSALEKRLRFSRQAYLCEDQDAHRVLVERHKRSIRRKEPLRKLIRLIKRRLASALGR